ncbi:MAG TPA: glycosyltransferase [Polyangia bacterium]
MKLTILSRRGLISSVSWDPVYELEQLVATACDGSIVAPRARAIYQLAEPAHGRNIRGLRGLVRRTIGAFEPAKLGPKSEPEMLLVIGISAFDMEVVRAIPEWRQRFDLVMGYIIDCWWGPESFPDVLPKFDRFFIGIPDELDQWNKDVGVPTTLIPFGVDALTEGSDRSERPIDLLSYGRLPDQFRRAFSRRFARPDSRFLYLPMVPRAVEQYPLKSYEDRNDHPDSALLFQMLRKSKTSICFDTKYPGMRPFPYSIVTFRWYDAIATGTAVVGKRPTTAEAGRLLNWPDATIEIDDDPALAIEQLEALFGDEARLGRIYLRNHYEALRQHDWRLRVAEMYRVAGVSLPPGLVRQLEELDQRVTAARQKAADGGALTI